MLRENLNLFQLISKQTGNSTIIITRANGGAALSANNTAFSSSDKTEGSHAVVFSNNDDISMGGNATTFPSMGGYNQRTIALWLKPSSTTGKKE